ncbi:MAG TPA: protein kinase [Vicinamibacterales bacterium]|jgi:non-specific serine/threonine protein kinase/serine/threonine-protein kinase|nr:protein kinase [Vicinamibacterales bacterium]
MHRDHDPLTPVTWARVTDLFEQAVGRPAAQREALLSVLRLHEPLVAAEVASLLESHDRPGDFLPSISVDDEPPDLAGRSVGAYRLLTLLGTGGAGAVYLAERSDGSFAKRVAVKLLSSGFVPLRDRFLRERDFLAGLEHPNIARLLDAGTTDDHLLYLVMEYVEGLPIDRHCEERALRVTDRIALLLQVCAGVAYAHRHLIIHCDIKPENVLVTRDGQVKLLDFGIARPISRLGTITRHRPATPAYSSPEQLQGEALTTASDVYSLGVLAHVVLTGSSPYALRTTRLDELVSAVVTAEPQRASLTPGLAPQVARQLRGDIDTVLTKALAKDPARRYASVEQMAGDLERFRTGYPVLARPDSFAYWLRKSIGRHRLAAIMVAILAAGLFGTAILSMWQARLAEQRFDDLRAFAHTVVFDVNDALAPIAGTTAARKLVVETALRYLDRLFAEGSADAGLREELAAGYIGIGKVQGGAFLPNLGDAAGAVASFRKAIAISSIAPTRELERSRVEALISIAQLSVDPIAGAPEFAEAVDAANRLLDRDASDPKALRLLADAYHGLATVAHLTNDVPRHVAMATRQIETRERLRALGAPSWPDEASLARAIAQLALALEQRGDYEAALAQLERAHVLLETAIAGAGENQMLQRGLAEVRSRKTPVLLALKRIDSAATEAEAAVSMLEPLVATDPANVQYHADLAYAWLRLGDARRAEGRLKDSLDLHRRALAVRRERAERHAGFIFVPWELTRSLNSVADLLLTMTPARPEEAATLFEEARTVGMRTLAVAPSFTQVRKQVAVASEGAARAGAARGGNPQSMRLAESAGVWREVVARSVEDPTSVRELSRLEALTTSARSAEAERR